MPLVWLWNVHLQYVRHRMCARVCVWVCVCVCVCVWALVYLYTIHRHHTHFLLPSASPTRLNLTSQKYWLDVVLTAPQRTDISLGVHSLRYTSREHAHKPTEARTVFWRLWLDLQGPKRTHCTPATYLGCIIDECHSCELQSTLRQTLSCSMYLWGRCVGGGGTYM